MVWRPSRLTPHHRGMARVSPRAVAVDAVHGAVTPWRVRVPVTNIGARDGARRGHRHRRDHTHAATSLVLAPTPWWLDLRGRPGRTADRRLERGHQEHPHHGGGLNHRAPMARRFTGPSYPAQPAVNRQQQPADDEHGPRPSQSHGLGAARGQRPCGGSFEGHPQIRGS
jgi:hypothetical protein